jgi:mRNA interferase MazF
VRGDVYQLKAPRDARGREQRGRRFAVVVQASRLEQLSTWLVVPTSASAQSAVFRPEVEIPGHGRTLVLCDALTAVDPVGRLGALVGYLTLEEMKQIDRALLGLLDLL